MRTAILAALLLPVAGCSNEPKKIVVEIDKEEMSKAVADGIRQAVREELASADNEADIRSAASQLSLFEPAIKLYYLNVKAFPKSLADLRVMPSGVPKWNGPYLEKEHVDPWGREYRYANPGRHNEDFDIWSAGPDGKDGTADDIGNWN